MSHPTIRGSLVALITPFNEDGSVNFDKLGELIDFHLANSTDALVILGTTGESSTMSHEEDNAVCEYTVKRVAGRIPVIAGSGSNSTQTMLEKSLSYERLGADGLLLITPYYNKTNEEGMYLHFKTVADAVKIPCILYNVPGRTDDARRAQIELLDVINDLFIEVNPVPVKEAMNLLGMDVGGYRLPLTHMTEAHRETLRSSLAAAGFLK